MVIKECYFFKAQAIKALEMLGSPFIQCPDSEDEPVILCVLCIVWLHCNEIFCLPHLPDGSNSLQSVLARSLLAWCKVSHEVDWKRNCLKAVLASIQASQGKCSAFSCFPFHVTH